MFTTALSGFGLSLSLIAAIGAQNAFVLRQGIRRQHVIAVVLVCALSDLVLMGVGIAGGGILFTRFPVVAEIARYAGAAFLIVYGALAFRRAARPGAALVVDSVDSARARSTTTGIGATVGTALALTWLNPHVYLDTIVLLGSVAASHGDQRWVFGIGAWAGSLVWFTALALGARALAPLFAKPAAWRVLDIVVGGVMLLVATMLVLPH